MRLLTTKDVLAIVQMSRTTLYFMIKEGRFPEPVILGKRNRRWRENDVREWVAAQ